MSGPRGGRRGCGWRRCRWPGIRIRGGSRRSSPGPSGRWRSTCWPRCWTGRARRCGGCCCGPACLERVNGELADLLTGGSGGERVLQDLEEANAFVVSLDPARSWFRYHHLFAGLLQLELRRTEPEEVTALHELAARWLAGHGYPVEAIRHAQAARDWGLAARLLADHWPGLYLGGQEATVHALLAGFPAGAPRPTPSWRRWPRPMSWPGGRWRRRSGTWEWPSAGWRRCRRAGAGRRRCCSGWSGCWWLAGAEPAGAGRAGAAVAGPGRGPGRGAL